MSAGDVARVLGPPKRVATNYLGEREDQWDGVFVRYAGDGGVIDLSLRPTEELLFHGADLLSDADPVPVLLRTDPHPVEWVGYVISLALGVSLTGHHDDDHSRRAITVFAPGRFDGYRDQFTPMTR
jgi:hypothetical protein